MLKVTNITEGFYKLLKGTDNPQARERAKTCSTCPEMVEKEYLQRIGGNIEDVRGKMCSVCGCALAAKILVNNEKCPLNKW